MSGNRRRALLVSAALVGGTMLLTACQDPEPDASTTPPPAGSSASGSSDGGEKSGQSAGGSESGSDSGAARGSGDGQGGDVQQQCGANDLSWNAKSVSQAGGFLLVSAKAKPGITCVLPAGMPTVAFGSDGTEAKPAEQSAGQPIELSGNTTAYAGVQPKTSKENGGKELDSIIVGIGRNDPNPERIEVGTIVVDEPVATGWHKAPTDAVPL